MTDAHLDACAADDLRPGDVIEVEIGPVAHGGHCVARFQGRVIFVRLTLPGELAKVRITEVRRGSFCRGEAVAVLRADPERVAPPCVHFGPGGCGGCDFQHASGDRQRMLKAAVVTEQLHRLAGLEVRVLVEELPGAGTDGRIRDVRGEPGGSSADALGPGFGWRTRVRWALDLDGRIGPRAVRSHRVVGVNPGQPCLIAAPGLNELAATAEVPAGVRRPATAGRPQQRGRRLRDRASRPELPEVVLTAAGDGSLNVIWPDQPGSADTADPATVLEHAVARDFAVAADGFWQVHPAAADTLAGAVRQALTGIELIGGSSWDLYGGVGLFAEVLAEVVGETGSVLTVEGDRLASALAEQNMAGRPQVSAVLGAVEKLLDGLADSVDAVVLDPPRAGAGPQLCQQIAARAPAVIVYVACDPAALGRDTAALIAAGYRLDTLRAFDCFPQTHHIECVARFLPVPSTS